MLAFPAAAFAQTGRELEYSEATDFTIVGKLMPGRTSNPYHRVDTTLYKGFTPMENFQVRMTSGMACAFVTDSRNISILTEYGQVSHPTNTNGISARGYDLYLHRKDGSWLWAASGVCSDASLAKPLALLSSMDGTEHEFLLYFPLYSEEYSIKIGTDKGSSIRPAENPFRHRVAVWGSSYTHGSSTSRAGMTYPAQLARRTGIQMLSLGCSGNCLLQPYFADVLVDVDADAFIFDTFSNPRAPMIEERLVPFIDRMVAAHPGKPLIFQQTIYRETRNLDGKTASSEQAKMDMAERIFRELKSTAEGRRKYRDVYLIHPVIADGRRESTVDGTHPDNHGYTLWAESIEKPVMKILRKYGIR